MPGPPLASRTTGVNGSRVVPPAVFGTPDGTLRSDGSSLKLLLAELGWLLYAALIRTTGPPRADPVSLSFIQRLPYTTLRLTPG